MIQEISIIKQIKLFTNFFIEQNLLIKNAYYLRLQEKSVSSLEKYLLVLIYNNT